MREVLKPAFPSPALGIHTELKHTASQGFRRRRYQTLPDQLGKVQPLCGNVRRSDFVFLSSREAGHTAAFGGVSEKLISLKLLRRVHDEGHFFNFSTLADSITASGEGRFPVVRLDQRGWLILLRCRSHNAGNVSYCRLSLKILIPLPKMLHG